jgi:hypothetical protein
MMRGIGEWVKVEDAEPELLHVDLLIWPDHDFTDADRHFAEFRDGGFYVWCEDHGLSWEEKVHGVTHWMYFPNAPDQT